MFAFKSILRKTAILTILIILLLTPLSIAVADTEGPNNPATGINVSTIGTQPWVNPENITEPGSPYATDVLYNGHRYSNYLQGTQYGFTIPANASIVGIEVAINRMSSSRNPNVVDNVVSLVKGGAIVGDNKAIPAAAWPIVLTIARYGGATDLWGTTWTPEEINSPDFGVALAAYRDNNGNNSRAALVDTMQISVYYEFTTTTSVICGDGTSITYGDSVTCIATVSRITGDLTPSGTVTWTANVTGTFEPNPCILMGAGGVATCSTTYTPRAVGGGAHLVTATYDGDGYYTPSNGSQTVNVLIRPISITANPQTKVYGTLDPQLTYQLTEGSLVFNDAFTGNLSRDPGENVGSYTILQGSLVLSINYNLTYNNGTLTITKAIPACEFTPYDLPFDGATHTATGVCAGVLGEDLAGLELSGTTHTDAGLYTDPWIYTDATGNYFDASGTIDDNISKVDAICVVTPYDVSYDGNPHTATGTCTGILGDLLTGLDLSGTTHTEVGNYTDTWTFANTNYNNQSGTIVDLITSPDATCVVNPYDLTYDGTDHTATGSCTGPHGEVLDGLDLSNTTHTDVGNYTDSWTFVNPNYTDQSGIVINTITKADASCNITPYDVFYDGNSHTAGGSCTGVLDEPLSGLDLTGTTHLNAGSYTDLWTFTDGSGNYNGQSGTVVDTISVTDAVCEITPYNVTYDGYAHTATGACTGVEGDPLSGLDLSNTNHLNAGTYTDPWSFTDATGNYHDQNGSIEDVIDEADAICEIEPYDVIYDGEAHTATGLCSGVNGQPLSGLDLDATIHTNAGSYSDPWTFTDQTGNYNDLSGTIEDLINKTNAICEVTPYDVTYDGETHTATGFCTGVNGEPLDGLDVNQTTHTDAGLYSDDWNFTDPEGNYYDRNGTVVDNINKADAICEIIPYIVEYDRLAHTATGACLGVMGEDLIGLDLTDTTHTEVNSYPNDPWTFNDASGNYYSQNGSVDDAITRRAITITADAKSKPYGQVDPQYTFQVTSGSLLTGDAFSGWLSRQPGEAIGTYPILQGTVALPDYYVITFVGADLTIIGERILFPVMLVTSDLH